MRKNPEESLEYRSVASLKTIFFLKTLTRGNKALKIFFMLNHILEQAVKKKASDIHLKVGSQPIIRKHGVLQPLFSKESKITSEDIEQIAFQVMSEEQQKVFLDKRQIDLSLGVPGLGRFRFNIFRQRGSLRIVIRTIQSEVPSLASLHLPNVIEKLALAKRGLILVTGATGSGKSTTLAAMVQHMNLQSHRHIITIEDPIEFLIKDEKSLISQRELGSDTTNFNEALRAALRQDPDVILIGEMRDRETIETALLAAATGHLVLSTLHTLNATETVNRIIGSFSLDHQQQIRLQLASVLKAVISQRLTSRPDNQGFAPATEILIHSTRIREMIEDPLRTPEIPKAIEEGLSTYGMQTFDQSLMRLVTEGVITYEEALRHATSSEDFAIKYSGIVHSDSADDKKWSDKKGYKTRIQDKWKNLTAIELEEIDDKTITQEKKGIRIRGQGRSRPTRRTKK